MRRLLEIVIFAVPKEGLLIIINWSFVLQKIKAKWLLKLDYKDTEKRKLHFIM